MKKLLDPKIISIVVGIAGLSIAQPLPNAAPMPYTQFQWFDNAGQVLAGGKICSFAAGTSTPLATYTDSTAATPNTNPVTLDSAGRGQIWLGPNLYKLVVKQGGTPGSCADGVVITSADNVADISLYFVNFVKTISTSNLITYTSALTGGVSRTAFAKFADMTSVKDFGACGDGICDDTAAINLAMAQSSLNRCIYFPDGTYATSAALSYNHPVCMWGQTWRLKYTNSPTIASVLALVGDPTNAYGVHGSFMEGSYIAGAIIDGQGHATNGLTLQGVVSSTMEQLRVTNVTNAGVMCNWCQQTTFSHLQVSNDFENFTTTPAYGIIIDNVSSANYLLQVNIDHVSVDGIWLKYALNTLIAGGTSEGNVGWGVRCDGAVSPARNCYNNTAIQLDTEVNGAGDYLFSQNANFNSVFSANSSSNPGVVFQTGAHLNTISGGSIGGGSSADNSTYGNNLDSVSSFSLTDPVWTDNGQNKNTRFRNNSTGTFTDAANNFNLESITRFNGVSNFVIDMYTPSINYADITVGNRSGPTWIGLNNQSGLAGWLQFPNAAPGMCFMSQTSYRGTSTPQGCIVSGNWGFGRFNTAPIGRFHFQDAGTTTMIVQAAPGQGGNDLQQWMGYTAPQDTPGTVLTKVDNNGIIWGPIVNRAPGGGIDTYATLQARTPCSGATQGTIGSISDSNTNVWGGAVASGGGAFKVGVWCDGSGWTVFAK